MAVEGPEGVHQYVREYDEERGLLIRSARYRDEAGRQPAVDKRGVFEEKFAYNEKRQLTRKEAWGVDGKPAEDASGDHLFIQEFDNGGCRTRQTRLRADGGANFDRELGVATERGVRDDKCNWVEQSFFDAADHPALGRWGYAKGRPETDADGRSTLVNFGVDGKPRYNALLGYAIKKTDPRTHGRTVDSYLGEHGELMIGPDGYAERRRTWNEHNRIVSEAYFGADGKPVTGPGPGGFHRRQRKDEAAEDFRYFDSLGVEIPALDRKTVVSVMFVADIEDSKQVAARAGVRAGDILWKYGEWSFVERLQAEEAMGTPSEKQLDGVGKAFFRERDLRSGGATTMTVIRDGVPVETRIPPLPGKTLGTHIVDRAVPIATFESWNRAMGSTRTAR